MRIGVTSVTFRGKTVAEIIRLAVEAKLDGIEWGGDIHVPAGDIALAEAVGEQTRQAGLEVLSYGSYYRGGEKENFTPVLASAKALGAPVIRIWAGEKTWEESTDQEKEALALRLREASEMAKEEGISLALEYHRGTATQTITGALELLREVHDGNLFCYWQPNPEISKEEQLSEIDSILPFLQNIHVFYWTEKNERHLLEEGRSVWNEYLQHIREGGLNHDLILEFVRDDAEECFVSDVKTLQELLAELKK